MLLLPQRADALARDDHVKPSEIAIAAIFKNEAEYLKEWIEFHRIVGVDRFYLYDNGSSDQYLAILAPYIRSGEVILTPWRSFVREVDAQRLAYAHAACNCAPTVQWLVYIDLDEFLFSETNDDIKAVFNRFDEFTTLIIPRFEFGTNGHVEKPAGLVIENYTRANTRGAHKSAVRPHQATEVSTHDVEASGNRLTIQAGGSGTSELRINHYFSKSESEFRRKLQRGWDWRWYHPDITSLKQDRLKSILNTDDAEYSMSRFAEKLRSACDAARDTLPARQRRNQGP
jgi:hypothetical protein